MGVIRINSYTTLFYRCASISMERISGAINVVMKELTTKKRTG